MAKSEQITDTASSSDFHAPCKFTEGLGFPLKKGIDGLDGVAFLELSGERVTGHRPMLCQFALDSPVRHARKKVPENKTILAGNSYRLKGRGNVVLEMGVAVK